MIPFLPLILVGGIVYAIANSTKDKRDDGLDGIENLFNANIDLDSEAKNLPNYIKKGKNNKWINTSIEYIIKKYRNKIVAKNGGYSTGFFNKHIDYREAKTTIDLDDYFIQTEALFIEIPINNNDDSNSTLFFNEFDKKWNEIQKIGEFKKSPLSSSEYVIDKKNGIVYRNSNHWGRAASCYWDIKPLRKMSGSSEYYYAIAYCKIKDFKINNRFGKSGYVLVNPEYIKGYPVYKKQFEAFLNKISKMLNKQNSTHTAKKLVEKYLTDLKDNLSVENIKYKELEKEFYKKN